MSWLTFCSFFLAAVSAINIPIQRRDNTHSASIQITNEGDTFYAGSIVVDGQTFLVDLDTGSSDLWINTDGVKFGSEVVNTGTTGRLDYGDGTEAAGPILIGSVTFGGEFTIPKQAFISAPGSNATHNPDKGLMGIGPPALSDIYFDLVQTQYSGKSIMQNLFGLYPDEPSYMTFLLSRSESGTTDGGIFTIGEYAPSYSSIASSPKILVTDIITWTVATTGVTINGQSLPIKNTVGNPGQLISLLDTGTTFLRAPSYIVDAMFKNVAGSAFAGNVQGYLVPCDTKINATLTFGSVVVHIDPIDTVVFDHFDDDGNAVCLGTWLYVGDLGFDFILGDTFLRNAYVVMNFGNMLSSDKEAAFVQLQSITDPATAWANYDQINAQRIAAAKSSSGSPSSSGSDDAVVGGALSTNASSDGSSVDLSGLTRNTYIIIGMLGGVLVLLVGVLIRMLRKGNTQYRTVSQRMTLDGDDSYKESGLLSSEGHAASYSDRH